MVAIICPSTVEIGLTDLLNLEGHTPPNPTPPTRQHCLVRFCKSQRENIYFTRELHSVKAFAFLKKSASLGRLKKRKFFFLTHVFIYNEGNFTQGDIYLFLVFMLHEVLMMNILARRSTKTAHFHHRSIT